MPTNLDALRHAKQRAENTPASSVGDLTQHNIQTILELEKSEKHLLSRTDRFAKAIAKFGGSMPFVAFNLIFVTAWIIFNSWPGKVHFDPFPFNLLGLMASVEAILISTFILISQNHDAALAEQRNQLDLQINLLAEQENTKMLAMLKLIANKLGVDVSQDPDVEVLEQMTEPEQLAAQIKELREHDGDQ